MTSIAWCGCGAPRRSSPTRSGDPGRPRTALPRRDGASIAALQIARRRSGKYPDDLDAAAAMFVANFAHLQGAPADYPLVGDTTQNPYGDIAPASLGGDGIKCIKKGVSTFVQWDDYGGAHSAWVVPGTGKHCFGKCGDCGFGPDQWTLDCTEHDQCGKASTGSLDWNPFDPQCGDEFQHATDDFTLFWIKRCRG